MFEEISKMATKRRIMLVRNCLKMIMGSGQNTLYWELRKLFAKTPIEAQCSVLKAFDFPRLQRQGWDNPMVRASVPGERGPAIKPLKAYEALAMSPPPQDGSMVVDFSAAKTGLFRCMCEERSIEDETRQKKMKSEERSGAGAGVGEEDVLGGAEEAEIGAEPKLKNLGEAKAVNEIEREESRIDAEEKELAGDPATEDLVDGVI